MSFAEGIIVPFSIRNAYTIGYKDTKIFILRNTFRDLKSVKVDSNY